MMLLTIRYMVHFYAMVQAGVTSRASSAGTGTAQGLNSARQAPGSSSAAAPPHAATQPAGGVSQLADWDSSIGPAIAALSAAAETLGDDVRGSRVCATSLQRLFVFQSAC